jgi:hypothetical protein
VGGREFAVIGVELRVELRAVSREQCCFDTAAITNLNTFVDLLFRSSDRSRFHEPALRLLNGRDYRALPYLRLRHKNAALVTSCANNLAQVLRSEHTESFAAASVWMSREYCSLNRGRVVFCRLRLRLQFVAKHIEASDLVEKRERVGRSISFDEYKRVIALRASESFNCDEALRHYVKDLREFRITCLHVAHVVRSFLPIVRPFAVVVPHGLVALRRNCCRR